MGVPREPNSLATPSFYKPTRESSHYQLSIDFSCASDRFGEHPSAATIALQRSTQQQFESRCCTDEHFGGSSDEPLEFRCLILPKLMMKKLSLDATSSAILRDLVRFRNYAKGS
jgi:hypothetical protein